MSINLYLNYIYLVSFFFTAVTHLRDIYMLAIIHLTPELVMGQREQPPQVLSNKSGMFQKLLHLSRRAIFQRGLVRHETALLLPGWVLTVNRQHKVSRLMFHCTSVLKSCDMLTHQCRQRVLFSQRARLGHLLFIQWHESTGHRLTLSNLFLPSQTNISDFKINVP